MTRLEKQEFVQRFSEDFAHHPCMIVVRQSGLSAGAVAQLRRQAREAGVVFQVVKNRLAKRALPANSPLNLLSQFSGSTGVVLCHDPVAGAKLVVDFSKKRENLFFPLAGLVDGKVVSQEAIKKLASLPALPQIRAQLLALVQTPARQLLATLREPAARLVRILENYRQKN